MHRQVSVLFISSLLITVVAFVLWIPHWELFGATEGNWGLLIPLWLVGFFVTFISGLMLIALGVQAVLRWLLGESRSRSG